MGARGIAFYALAGCIPAKYARCVVLSAGRAGPGRAALCRKRGQEYFEQWRRVFDQNLSKGLVAPLWPAFRVGITCHCDQKRGGGSGGGGGTERRFPGYEY